MINACHYRALRVHQYQTISVKYFKNIITQSNTFANNVKKIIAIVKLRKY